MSNINYDRFTRVLIRCKELAAAPDKPPILAAVFKESAEAKIDAFLAANKAVDAAATAFAKENKEALAALAALDGPYRVARVAVAAVLPETVLPDTLKSLPTDTDKLNAIDELLDIVDDHQGKAWADTLLQGEFGAQVPKTLKEVHEAIAANVAASKAGSDRAIAYGPALEAYNAFKRVVRNALGPASKDYRRIHLRASPSAADKGETDISAPPAPPAETSAPPAGEEPKPA